ncbi:choice-of-anchor Q domain-containing protein [Paenibacillus gyeongsangnamensis]
MKKVFVGALALGLLSCTWFGAGKWNTAAAASAIYYVSPNGNDGNLGTSVDAPFRTIQKAADVAGAGSTILVRGGIYNESVTVTNSGSSLNGYITFQNYAGETPVIDGTNLPASNTGLFNIANKSYIRLQGFEIRNFRAGVVSDIPIGVHIEGTGQYIEILNNYVHHIETGFQGGNALGIAVFGTSSDSVNNLNHIVIDHNEVANLKLGLSEAVSINGNVDTFQVTNNKVHDNNNIGIVMIGFEGVSPDSTLDQARNGTVVTNVVYNNSSNGNSSYTGYSAGGIYVDGGKDIVIERNDTHDNDIGIEVTSEHAGHYASGVTVRNNLIYRNIMSGITLGGYDQYRGYTQNCFFLNNTIFSNDTLAMNYGQITFNYNTQNNTVQNNLIYGSATNVLISNPFTENAGNVLDSNLYFTTSGDQAGLWQWKNVSYTGFANYKSATGNDSHSIFADPKFMNLTTPDLHLQSVSLAINAGQNLPNIGDTDYDGNARIQGGIVDIGAFEAR